MTIKIVEGNLLDAFDAGEVNVVGFPFKMGSDRAGGDWNIVLEMIDFHFQDNEVIIYKL